jgi:hypothetical protein
VSTPNVRRIDADTYVVLLKSGPVVIRRSAR